MNEQNSNLIRRLHILYCTNKKFDLIEANGRCNQQISADKIMADNYLEDSLV